MKKLVLLTLALWGMGGFVPPSSAGAEEGDLWNLPPPVTEGGKPLMETLTMRHSDRNFSDRPISGQTLSDLLWAAWGINRPDGKRTAPTAMNKQQVMVFAALENGVWLYDSSANILTGVLPDDTRMTFGGAPLTLLYAAPAADEFAGIHIGSIHQNAGLYCASAGLANVVKATGRDALDGKLTLPDGYRVFLVHSIGWPR